MKIPPSASSDEQAAWRDVWAAIARLEEVSRDRHGQVVTNAGDASAPADLTTLRQVRRMLQEVAPPADGDFATLQVRRYARVLGTLALPRLSDGTAHYAILFVNAAGEVAINEDGEYALDLNLTDGELELGYNLRVKWFNRSDLGSSADGQLDAHNDAGTKFLKVTGGGGAKTTLSPGVAATALGFSSNDGSATGQWEIDTSGHLRPVADASYTVGDATHRPTAVHSQDFVSHTATALHSAVTLTDGAGANLGTLTNAPSAGDPTKWLLVNDNGTTRKIPAW